MSVSQTQLFILLAHMLKTPSILELARRNLRAAYFRDPEVGGTYFHAFVFDIICSHFDKFNTPPDCATIHAELWQLMKNFWPGADHPSAQETIALCQRFFDMLPIVEIQSIPNAREAVDEINRICVYNVEARRAIENARTSEELEDLTDKLTKLRIDRKHVVGVESTNGLYTGRETGEIIRVQTGIDFLDRRLGDGAGPYAHCGAAILAAQGAGKTTFSIQLCIAQIMMGHPALLVLTEQGWDSSISCKAFSCLTGIPWKIIGKHKGDVMSAARTIPDANLDLIQEKLNIFDKYFHVLDMMKYPGGMESIKTQVDTISLAHGQPPGMVLIDWAGPLANTLMALNSGRFERKEAALKHIAGQVCEIGTEMKTFCVVTQQMAPAQVAKGPSADADHYCSQDCRGFTESLRYVITINPADKDNGIQKIRMPKTREDPPNQIVLVRLNAEVSSFTEATGWRQAGRRFQQTNFKGAAMPSEGPKRNATVVE